MQRPCISLSRIPMTQSNGGTLRSVEKSDYLHRCAQFKGEIQRKIQNSGSKRQWSPMVITEPEWVTDKWLLELRVTNNYVESLPNRSCVT